MAVKKTLFKVFSSFVPESFKLSCFFQALFKVFSNFVQVFFKLYSGIFEALFKVFFKQVNTDVNVFGFESNYKRIYSFLKGVMYQSYRPIKGKYLKLYQAIDELDIQKIQKYITRGIKLSYSPDARLIRDRTVLNRFFSQKWDKTSWDNAIAVLRLLYRNGATCFYSHSYKKIIQC